MLLRAALFATVGALPFTPYALSPRTAARVAERNPRGVFRSHQEISGLGRAYCLSYPQEADPDRLDALIGARAAGSIEASIRRDFLDADTVLLEGWVLARTEARFFALYFLQNESHGAG